MPSLYVHVPFCQSKCAYCAFYSVQTETESINKYFTGLEQETKRRATEAPSGVFSLYLGGGTPSVLNTADLAKLLELLHQNFIIMPQIKESQSIPQKAVEKTCEANPGTLDSEKMAVLVGYGINRISLGAQCFNDKILKTLGRIHSSEDIETAVRVIRKAGIENLSLDLIFGLPGQTLTDWQDTLTKAISLEPEHLSLYALMLENSTPLGQKYLGASNIDLPDDDLQADMYEWAVEFLAAHGYIRYEVANFAKQGYECRHNLAYWQLQDYIGLGPAAVSCLNNRRTKNEENINSYAARLLSGGLGYQPEDVEILSLKVRIAEYVFLGLRMAEGIDLKEFKQRFNREIQDIYGPILTDYLNRGFLLLENGKIKINPAYLFVANSILQKFV
jgi:oxygen-independent coproporphyrinogen-3 oxidase